MSRLGRWMNGAGDEHHMHNCQVSRLSRVLEDLSHVLLARTRQPFPCLEWSGRCKSAALERENDCHVLAASHAEQQIKV